MNDWVNVMAGRIKTRRQDRPLNDAKFVEVQRIKRTKAEPLWKAVRNQVRENCDALNKKMGEAVLTFEIVADFEISVRTELDGQHNFLHVDFDAERCVLSWSCGKKQGKWEVIVSEDGSLTSAWGMGIPSNPASIANEMLTALLGF